MKKLIIVLAILGIVSISVYLMGYPVQNLIVPNNFEPHTIKGIDVSHHQGHINWDKVKEDNIRFVFIKSTQGVHFVDSQFIYNSTNAKRNGIKVGAYHFYKFGRNPHHQFLNIVKNTPKEILDFPLVIDLEYLDNDDLGNIKNKDAFVKELTILEKLVTNHYGVKPIFYTTSGFYQRLIENHFSNEIWMCYLKNEKIDFIHTNEWNFRQYSFNGRIKGINGDVDLDFFKGSEEEFNKILLKKSK